MENQKEIFTEKKEDISVEAVVVDDKELIDESEETALDIVESTATALMLPDTTIQKMSVEEYEKYLDANLKVNQIQRRHIIANCNTYNCWNKIAIKDNDGKTSGYSFAISSQGIKRIMAPLGICCSKPIFNDKAVTSPNPKKAGENKLDMVLVTCEFDMWTDRNPNRIVHCEGTVSSKEPFYAKAGGVDRDQQRLYEEKVGRLKSHARTRATKAGIGELLSISPTQEELEEVKVPVAKVRTLTF